MGRAPSRLLSTHDSGRTTILSCWGPDQPGEVARPPTIPASCCFFRPP